MSASRAFEVGMVNQVPARNVPAAESARCCGKAGRQHSTCATLRVHAQSMLTSGYYSMHGRRRYGFWDEQGRRRAGEE